MKGLIVLVCLVLVALLGVYAVGHYRALSACVELEQRLDEAGRPPAPGTPVTDEGATAVVRTIASELGVEIEDIQASLEPLTRENAASLSAQAQQAMAIAAKLPNYAIQGRVLSLTVRARAQRLLAGTACRADRRMLVATP